MRLSRRRVLGVGAACAGLAIAGPARAEEISFPIRLRHNVAWTTAKIDAFEPVPFRLETAARAMTIAQAEAERMGLKPVKTASVPGASASSLKLVQYQPKSILIGGALMMPETTRLTANPFAQPADFYKGGFEPAQGAPLLIDFAGERVRFISSIAAQTKGLASIGYSGPETSPAFRPPPVISVTIDGIVARLTVDTASLAGVALNAKFVKAHDLWSRPGVLRKGGASPLGGDLKIVRGAMLEIASHKFGAPVLTLSDPAAGERMAAIASPGAGGADSAAPTGASAGARGGEAAPMTRTDGVIGMDMLRRFVLMIDPRTTRFWVTPNAMLADGYRYDRAGLDLADAGGTVSVTGLADGAPAQKAGLRMGDKVTGWNGDGGIGGLLFALTGAPGSVVAVQIERDGASQLVEIELSERV